MILMKVSTASQFATATLYTGQPRSAAFDIGCECGELGYNETSYEITDRYHTYITSVRIRDIHRYVKFEKG